jgi:anti-sigma regulatory factor (Ser/Thr protein kinase)
MKEQTSRFEVNLANLEQIRMFISKFMQEACLCDEQIHNFEVSADEHFSNLISITCREDHVKAQVTIADTSAGFDPRHYSIPDVEKEAVYELPPGGFGNYFICELMDEVDYIHQPYVKNELILTVYKKNRHK